MSSEHPPNPQDFPVIITKADLDQYISEPATPAAIRVARLEVPPGAINAQVLYHGMGEAMRAVTMKDNASAYYPHRLPEHRVGQFLAGSDRLLRVLQVEPEQTTMLRVRTTEWHELEENLQPSDLILVGPEVRDAFDRPLYLHLAAQLLQRYPNWDKEVDKFIGRLATNLGPELAMLTAFAYGISMDSFLQLLSLRGNVFNDSISLPTASRWQDVQHMIALQKILEPSSRTPWIHFLSNHDIDKVSAICQQAEWSDGTSEFSPSQLIGNYPIDMYRTQTVALLPSKGTLLLRSLGGQLVDKIIPQLDDLSKQIVVTPEQVFTIGSIRGRGIAKLLNIKWLTNFIRQASLPPEG